MLSRGPGWGLGKDKTIQIIPMSRISLSSDREFELSPGAIDAIGLVVSKLLNKHRKEISKSVRESEDKKLPVRITINTDASQSADQFDVTIRFTTGTVTDTRVVKGDPENQGVFENMTLDELTKAEKALESQREAEKANADGGGDKPADEKPRRGRKTKAETSDAT